MLRRVVRRALAAGPRPSSATAPVPLTDRERDVLRLVAAGRSNAEIARELFIGVTTVKTHVGNVMSKTDSRNRVQLAVLAGRLGLAGG